VVFLGVCFGDGDSVGFASGVGSGVGVAATSVTGGAGSSIRAPVDVTRFPFLAPGVAGVSLVGVSFSEISGPPAIDSKERRQMT